VTSDETFAIILATGIVVALIVAVAARLASELGVDTGRLFAALEAEVRVQLQTSCRRTVANG
jgi:hypothetical protein